MRIDKSFEFSSDRIIIDSDINIDRLGWRAGDYFRVTNINGQTQLVRVDPLIAFVRDAAEQLAKSATDTPSVAYPSTTLSK